MKSFGEVKSQIGVAAVINLFRITNQWEGLLAWHERHRLEVERLPQSLSVVLRALGETGDIRGLVGFYDEHRRQIAGLMPAAHRDSCRLMLFAFCGRPAAVERLCAGSLAVLPAPIRAFWRATADLAAGATGSARRQFEELLPGADPPLHNAIERRLSQVSLAPGPLDAACQRVIDEAAAEHGHDEKFGARPSLFTRRPGRRRS